MKDFDAWNEKKKKADELPEAERIFFQEREIFFLRLGVNIGIEQDGGKNFLRPVLIFKKLSRKLFFGIPLSSRSEGKEGNFFFPFLFRGKKQILLLAQARVFDSKRLKYYAGRVSPEDFSQIKKATRELLF